MTNSSPYIKKVKENHFQIFLASTDKVIANITVSLNVMTILYSSELLLEEFMIIHEVISQLANENDNIVDDSNSFIGYLPNGEPVYIVRNWKPWLEFIQKSMKYCNN